FLFGMLFDQLLNDLVKQFILPLTGSHANEVAFRIDYRQCGPGATAVIIPDFHAGVVDHRMLDLITKDGLANGFSVFLIVELGGMHADHHDFFFVFLLQPGQIGQCMNAVDAAESPEIEDDDFSLEVAVDLDGTGAINPGDSAFQFRRFDPLVRFLRIKRTSEWGLEPGSFWCEQEVVPQYAQEGEDGKGNQQQPNARGGRTVLAGRCVLHAFISTEGEQETRQYMILNRAKGANSVSDITDASAACLPPVDHRSGVRRPLLVRRPHLPKDSEVSSLAGK